MLVLMPTEGIAHPGFIWQAQAGAVTSPQLEAFPAFGRKAAVEYLGGVKKEACKEYRFELSPGLHKGAFGGCVQLKRPEEIE